MGFKDLPGGKNNKDKKNATEFAKEISPKTSNLKTEKNKWDLIPPKYDQIYLKTK